ncbi:transketolase [Salinactinospora qingdaonensis]|uniref:Thiamine pyrophosphate-dependent enzyme n=1 Tax=Salinactinospora qingdaonensis TaxID=702744 RepID=A0ABP7FP88_9ACTN
MATTLSRYADLPALIGLMTGDDKHQAATESTLDALWVLYDSVLNISPDRADDPGRDRLLLSKGHGPAAYYAVLAAKGFLSVTDLRSWATFASPLGHHPDRVLVPGAEISSGSLGHGLGLGVGTALGLRAQGRRIPRVVVLLGDGELDEGSNHEAIVTAGRLSLDNLTAVVVDNRSASLGWPHGIAHRFEVEGWKTRTVSGRDHTALHEALTGPHAQRPLAVVARATPKGRAA